jgi:digeranylgeranylglycerophospholipid reductase
LDDVIVVGAGPAGNNAALGLALKGFAVTVIDSRLNIGEKLCTGIVGQECTRRFPIDPELVYREASSINVVAPSTGDVRFEAATPRARIVDRVAYVASFARQAQAAGANYLLGQRVLKVTPEADGVTVLTDSGSHRGRALVLATGFGSPLTPQVGLGTVSDYVTGAQAQVSTNGVSEVEVFLGQQVAPGFFAWLVPTAPGLALAGLLVRRRAQAQLGEFIDWQLKEGKIAAVTSGAACWGIPLRPLRRTYRDRVLVVGDAAGQVKPTTGGGIYYALLASEIAAQALSEALSDNDLSAARLSTYQRRWKLLLSQELEVGYSARRIYEALSDQQISSLVRQSAASGVLYDLANAPDTSFDWHSRLIGKVLGHPVLGGALRLVNPLLARLARPPEPDFTHHPVPGNRPDPLSDLSTY